MSPPHKLPVWLREVIDDLGIHTRADWALILGTSVDRITRWVEGDVLPTADNLWSIYTLLKYEYPTQAAKALEDWRTLTMNPDGGRSCSPIGEYVLTSHWANLRLAVEVFSFEEQAELLSKFIGEARGR